MGDNAHSGVDAHGVCPLLFMKYFFIEIIELLGNNIIAFCVLVIYML